MFLLLTCLQKLVQESSVQDRQSLRLRPVHGLQAKEVHTAGQSRNVELLLMAALLFTLHDSPYLPSEHVVETDGYLLPFGHRVAKSGLLPGWIREGAQAYSTLSVIIFWLENPSDSSSWFLYQAILSSTPEAESTSRLPSPSRSAAYTDRGELTSVVITRSGG